jgi:organic radical activating enzyme
MYTNIVEINTTFNDIPHLSTTLWYSGCKLNCVGCHNTILENFKYDTNIKDIEKELIRRRKMTEWVVHLGGNPLDSINVVKEVSLIAQNLGFKQFLYSGYTFAEFQTMFDEKTHEFLLNTIDYIKTGRYDITYSKNCSEDGLKYFFETLNQEVYHSNKYNWERYYSFNLNENKIHGEFSLI